MAILFPALVACSTGENAGTAATGASAGVSSLPAQAQADVGLQLLSFVPPALTVKAGTTVTWRNEANITHTITSGSYETDEATGLRTSEQPDGAFDFRVAQIGDVVDHTFAKAGTHPYYCSIHKGMHGTVVVTE